MFRKYWPVFIMVFAFIGYILYDKNVNAKIVLTPHTFGSGKVSVIEYADFECPYCNAVYPILKKLREQYQNDITFEYRHLFTHTEKSILLANASECANEQGKFWEFTDNLYESHKNIEEVARKVGILNHRFRYCINKNKYVNFLLTKAKQYYDSGIKGTPTVVIQGQVLRGLKSEEEYVRILKEAIHETNFNRR